MTEGRHLDPADPAATRRALHDLLDAALDHAQAHPPWQPPPEGYSDRVALPDNLPPDRDVLARLARDVMPWGTGNTHPRFWGWVHGTGSIAAIGAEIVAAAMNANLGGRHQGAVAVERAVIRWTARLAGMPEASGILTTGTSQATILALCAARMRAFGDVRRDGIRGLPPLRVYVARGGHACIAKALEVMGHGRTALCEVAVDAGGGVDVAALSDAIAADRAAGMHPLAVVGTAGSVDLGAFDPLDALADLCAAQDLWLHVDAAYGLWTRLAEAPWSDLTAGIGRADSLAADYHKWIGVPYACGLCLIRDADLHRRTFADRPAYLAPGEGLAGGDWWAADHGTDLSRGFAALRVWTVLQAAGRDALGAAITDNCRQAALMGRLAAASDVLELAHPVIANVCVIAPRRGAAGDLAARLQLDGTAVFSTTTIAGKACLRAAIVNHRTTEADIHTAIAALETAVRS